MIPRAKYRLRLPSRTLILGKRTLIMGVLNITPDSFSDGGKFLNADAAAERAFEIESEGADILDIGGESTRPGAEPISAEEELARILPVLQKLHGKLKIPVSVDTRHAAAADSAIREGAEIINNVVGQQISSEMSAIARKHCVPVILMHMRGEPRTMQKGPFARDVMSDVFKGLGRALQRAKLQKIASGQILLDPGVGFGKNYRQNFQLLARLEELSRLGHPIVVGASRKAFIGAALGDVPPNERAWGTAAAVAASILGRAHIVRVHDVKEMVQVAQIADKILAECR